MKKINYAIGVVLATLLISSQAMAVTAYDAITAAASWSDAITALGVVAAALALVFVFRKGAKMVLGFFGR